jgi:nicotinamide-nucleotide amidase
MKLEREIGRLLIRKGLTLATAESCTGGLIAHRITGVPGSSAYFERGFVVYSNRSKIEELGVKAATIKRCGAVSPEVVRAMAEGAREAAGAGCAIAVTGIAGPISDESEKPVGLVYIAACVAARAGGGSSRNPVAVEKHNFKGTRLQIKKQSAEAALALLLKVLRA